MEQFEFELRQPYTGTAESVIKVKANNLEEATAIVSKLAYDTLEEAAVKADGWIYDVDEAIDTIEVFYKNNFVCNTKFSEYVADSTNSKKLQIGNLEGIELIDKERNEQLIKHGFSVESDVANYGASSQFGVLADVAKACIGIRYFDGNHISYSKEFPFGWPKESAIAIAHKPYRERLIIAGALIAAEIDRLIYIENLDNNKTEL